MAKILTDSSLNFKYATVHKATGNWDESNKLGQGGFGTAARCVAATVESPEYQPLPPHVDFC